MPSFHRLAAFALVGSVLVASPAFAHPKLVASTPAANTVVKGPTTITLKFSEKLMPTVSGVEIIMTSMPGMPNQPMPITGFRTAIDPEGTTLIVTLPRALTTGSYKVSWHAVSTDTHRIQGDLNFSVN